MKLPLALKWQKKIIDDKVISSPVLWNGFVYVACSDFVLALNADDGTLVWKFNVEGQVARELGLEDPIVAGDIVYIASKRHRLYALDANTCDIRWVAETGGEPRSPIVIENRVYTAVTESYLCCLRTDTGKLLWKTDTKSRIYSSPTPYKGLVILGTIDGLLACEQDSGRIKWRANVGAIVGTPVVNKGVTYAVETNGKLFALYAENGKPVWEWPALRIGGITAASPIIGDRGIVYVITHEPAYKGLWLHAIDPYAPYSRMELWDFKSQDCQSDLVLWDLSPAIAENCLFMGSLSTYVYAIDALTGKKLWRFETPARVASTPCVHAGCLYFTDQTGTVYAFASS